MEPIWYTVIFLIIVRVEGDLAYPSLTTTSAPPTLPKGCYSINTLKINCHGADAFPALSPKLAAKVKEIRFKDCKKDLGTLSRDHLRNYTILGTLAINNCGLSRVDEDTFVDNPWLKELDLSNNNLKVIGYATIMNIPSPKSINLANNPFVCNCSMVWISILDQHNFSLIRGEPTCADGRLLKSLSVPYCDEPVVDIYALSPNTGLNLGDNVTFTCNASGMPTPKVFWGVDSLSSNYTVSEDNTGSVTLHISNLTREDNKRINCFGKNTAWRTRNDVLVDIKLSPKVEHLDYHPNGPCLSYVISGTPPFNITWENNGEPLRTDESIQEDEVCADPSCSTYEYSKHKGCVWWKAGMTGGIYRVTVTNTFGSDNRSVPLSLSKRFPSNYPDLIPNKSFTYTEPPNHTDIVKDDFQEKTYTHVVAPIVAVVGVLAILLLGVYCRYRMKHGNKDKHISLGMDTDRQEMARLTQIPDMLENPHYHLLSKQSSRKLRVINIKELIFIKELGEGAFGRVYLGSCINLFTGDDRTMVAIKTLKTSVTEEALKDFEHEAELMADVSHENIVSFYGISYNGENLMMIFEYMENKDLNNYLRSNGPDASSLGYPTWNSSTLLISDLLYVAKQISAGMSYLATRHFVHRDLATRNCLVGEKLIVKIGDFGMSRDIYSTDYYKVGGQTMLPIRWMPPESVLYRKFTIESDVWSFGVVLWEIFSYGRQPWFELSNMEVIDYIKNGKLLQKPEKCTDELYELMLGCWHTHPSQRMTMCEIHDQLCNYLAPDSPYNNNSRSLENRECQQFTMLNV